jgi:hypothetical protein
MWIHDESTVFGHFWKFVNLMSFMDVFRKLLPFPPGVAQANPVAAWKTPWLVHLHPRLRGNVPDDDRTLGTCIEQLTYSTTTQKLYWWK